MGREEVKGVREALGQDRKGPRILCWNCKKLTPFHEERCANCGAKFAGSTGGVYSAPARPRPAPPERRDELVDARRSLMKLFEDLQRVHDVATRSHDQPRGEEEELSVTLFQCPSCGRFVAEQATDCACGVHFAASPAPFACPECGAQVSASEDACPVCRVRFAHGPEFVYQCPRCGAVVEEDAARCRCGALFAD